METAFDAPEGGFPEAQDVPFDPVPFARAATAGPPSGRGGCSTCARGSATFATFRPSSPWRAIAPGARTSDRRRE